MAFPLDDLTVTVFFHEDDDHTQLNELLTGSFRNLVMSGSNIRGEHHCPAADILPFFRLEGRVSGNGAILEEPETGFRYTGLLVLDGTLLQIVFGDYEPITNSPDMRERLKRLGLRAGQEQGTWVATKP